MTHPHLHRRPPRFVVVWLLVIALGIAVVAALGAVTVLAPAAHATPPHGHGHTPVTICHKGRTITVDDDAVPAHLAHYDTVGACPTPTPEPTEEPTWTPSPEPSSSATTPAQTPTPEPSGTPSVTPSPEHSVTPPSPTSSPSPSSPTTPAPTSSPVPSVTWSASSVPLTPIVPATTAQVPVRELAATGMGDGTRAGLAVVGVLVVIGAFLVLASRRRGA